MADFRCGASPGGGRITGVRKYKLIERTLLSSPPIGVHCSPLLRMYHPRAELLGSVSSAWAQHALSRSLAGLATYQRCTSIRHPPRMDIHLRFTNLAKYFADGSSVQAAGLMQFGVNLTGIPPGRWTSQRHWYRGRRIVCVIEGKAMLVTNRCEEILRAGDCVGFVAGVAVGHHTQSFNAGGSSPTHLLTYSRQRALKL